MRKRRMTMFEFVFSLVTSLFLPVVMLYCGWWFVTDPPDEINGLVGYKTKMSMKNGDTWAYAHRVSGIHWIICGILGLFCALALAVCGFTGVIEGDGCFFALMAVQGIQLVLLLSVIPVTEHKLKRRFNSDGTFR